MEEDYDHYDDGVADDVDHDYVDIALIVMITVMMMVKIKMMTMFIISRETKGISCLNSLLNVLKSRLISCRFFHNH